MKIKLFWSGEECELLEKRVKRALEELGLTDFIELEVSTDASLKEDMWIKEEPALIIEEETIDFKDIIFEWMVPEEEEIKSMFVSIIGWGGWWSCSDEWGCWTCSSGCG
jgi:hypothetical protein